MFTHVQYQSKDCFKIIDPQLVKFIEVELEDREGLLLREVYCLNTAAA